ncbi:MAG: M14 family metallopeptidase [Fibrobacterales bacterium]
MDFTQYYSNSYSEARKKFLKFSTEVGAIVSSVEHSELGPNGEKLYADYSLVGDPQAKKGLLLFSGTHGVEGFAGSAIQLAILKVFRQNPLKGAVKMIFVHGVNPYGMAYGRRADHQNIDVNRNFVDFSNELSRNIPYGSLACSIAPRNMSILSEIVAWSKLLLYRATQGRLKSQHALQKGQRSHERGLFFGGTKPSWSHRVLKKILNDHKGGIENLVVIDIHTGLGPYGERNLFSGASDHSEEAKNARHIWSNKFIQCVDQHSNTLEELPGTTRECVLEIFPKSNVTVVTMEFGTYNPIKVFRALRNENWAHHHADADSRVYRESKKKLLDCFYPNDLEWKQSVCDAGLSTIQQALNVLGR